MASPPELPVFFVDRCLGSKVVPDALRASGLHVEGHGTWFADDCPDEEWIAEVTRRGWVILTKDRRVRHRPIELEALKSAGAFAFVLSAGDLSGDEQAAAFILAVERMTRIAAKYAPPVIATVSRQGAVNVLLGRRRGGVRR